MRPLFRERIHVLAPVIWKRGAEGTAIIRGASEAAAAAARAAATNAGAAAAALELIFKQRLKSANVVPAVKTTLLRAPPGRGLTQYYPLSKLTGAAHPAAYAAPRRGRRRDAKQRKIAHVGQEKNAYLATIKYTSLYDVFFYSSLLTAGFNTVPITMESKINFV